MCPADVPGPRDTEPPHIKHSEPALIQVPVVIKNLPHVTMTVVAAQIMHHAFIFLVSFQQRLVISRQVSYLQLYVLVGLTECQIIYAYCIRARKIVDHTVTHTDTRVPDEGKEPGDQR